MRPKKEVSANADIAPVVVHVSAALCCKQEPGGGKARTENPTKDPRSKRCLTRLGKRFSVETNALARMVRVLGAARPHHAYLFANRRTPCLPVARLKLLALSK
jgi:hypothetical protein